MNVYTVIVTYNSEKWIRWCLTSLRESTHPVTTIVVDNASTDQTLSIVEKEFPEVVCFPQEKNLGFGQANNIGFRYVLEHEADAVLLLNSDAAVEKTAVQFLVEQNHADALLSPLHLNGKGIQLDYNFKFNTVCASENSFIDDLLLHQPQERYPVVEVCAACWFVPAQVLKRIGGFNPLFFHYGEDNNFQDRLRYHHIPICIIPQAVIYHDRVKQGNVQMFQRKLIDRELLAVFTNINNGKWVVARKSFSLMIKYFRHPLKYLVALCRTLGKLRKITKSRRLEKQDNTANWL